MQRCIATISISGTLEQKLEEIAAAGFDSIELFEPDLTGFPGAARQLRQRVDASGLKIALLQPFRNYEGESSDQLIRARQQFELMQELNCKKLLLCSNVSESCSSDSQHQIDDLHALAELAASFQVEIGYEALAWGRHINRWQQAWQRVKHVNHPNLGIVLDSFHILSRGDSLDELHQVPAEKITFVQFADAPQLNLDVLTWSRHYRCFPGQGDFDLQHFARQLHHHGYQGPWSLEIFNEQMVTSPLHASAADGYCSLRWLEQGLTQ
ncbi:sugar phosphate isomerase/epimerase [Erwiniaceae bacterium BAC15a-03b]|uniref:Sugar phosphate isomerase/epimerase n=1 Tax=Winslowiella arboricola TaxID=2978220 RepID=A0A9J6PXJ9_9GAMM|nr:sugar phosphate isomerase/epimerase family protein [Winslowiella arboricola]MCU5775594.1 sugar phosphate isomerase/epimerase [Winslowiella arboricola]MCU5779556.1 sugar phosphate isomerase/epimerase [Winslowiella arboricola]